MDDESFCDASQGPRSAVPKRVRGSKDTATLSSSNSNHRRNDDMTARRRHDTSRGPRGRRPNVRRRARPREAAPEIRLAVAKPRRRPAFADGSSALALGAGANAAVFGRGRVLRRPLPSQGPPSSWPCGQGEFVHREVTSGRERKPRWRLWQRGARGAHGLADDGGEQIKVTGARVSDNLFAVAGRPRSLGRTITAG